VIQASTISVQLRPNDFDRYGHLNSSTYCELIELGRWHWAKANSFDPDGSGVAAVVASLHVDFLKPVTWAPLISLEVATTVSERGAFRLVVLQEVKNPDGVPVAKARVELAMVDLVTGAVKPTAQILK
jgi:acyl-CoA thioesterase FadM